MNFKCWFNLTKGAGKTSKRLVLASLWLKPHKSHQFSIGQCFHIWRLYLNNITVRASSMIIGLAVTLLVVLAAMHASSVYAGNTGKSDIDSDAIANVTPGLRVLPPLGKDRMENVQADRTLTDFILVSIYEIDQNLPVYEFTSQKIHKGMGYIKPNKKFYHVNWDIAKADAGKTFEIHFVVAGLDIGQVIHAPKTGRTIPIRFQIDNTPRIRARILHGLGYSAMEIAQALIQEFNLDAPDIVQILYFENFTGLDSAEILRDLFGYDALATAQILKDTGFSIEEIAQMLQNSFDLEAQEGLKALFDLGFSPTEITQAARDVYVLDAYNAGLILKELGFIEYTIQGLLIEV